MKRRPQNRVSLNRGVRKGGDSARGWEVRCMPAGCGETPYRHASATIPLLFEEYQIARKICVTVRCRCAGGRAPSYRHPQRHVIVVPPGQHPPCLQIPNKTGKELTLVGRSDISHFFCSREGKGESAAQEEGGSVSYWESHEGRGFSPERGGGDRGAERVSAGNFGGGGGERRGLNIFFRGRKAHQVTIVQHFAVCYRLARSAYTRICCSRYLLGVFAFAQCMDKSFEIRNVRFCRFVVVVAVIGKRCADGHFIFFCQSVSICDWAPCPRALDRVEICILFSNCCTNVLRVQQFPSVTSIGSSPLENLQTLQSPVELINDISNIRISMIMKNLMLMLKVMNKYMYNHISCKYIFNVF